MAQLILNEQTEPATPSTGKVTMYPDSADSGKLKMKNDLGTVYDLTNASSVVGPGSSTDNAVSRFDGVTGRLIQNSTLILGDTGNITGAGTLNTHTIPGGTGTFALTSDLSTINHSALTGLTSGDDHTQYALLAGRAGGQSYTGGTASGENLTLSSTTNATKGKIFFGASSAFNQTTNSLGLGNTAPDSGYRLHMTSTGNTGIRLERTGVTGFNINTNASNVFNYSHDEAGGGRTYLIGASAALSTQLALATDGNVGIGLVAPSAKLHVIKTSEQLRLGYDTSNYMNVSVSSVGIATFDSVGAGAGFTFSDSITLADAKDIIVNTTTGTKIATAITQKLGFYNATPIAQRAGAAQVAVATTAATNVAPFGFTTGAQADSIITLLNELRSWAVAQGFIKGSS